MLQGEPGYVRRRQPRRLLEASVHRKVHRKPDRKVPADAERHVRHQGPAPDPRTLHQEAGDHRALAAERPDSK